jgi:predicted acetyltransferase
MCFACDMTFVGFAEPQLAMLASYVDALKQGWSPNTIVNVSVEQLADIAADPKAFLAVHADAREPGTRTLADGRVVPVLPMRVRWIWDGTFCGAINLRWQPGTEDLPDYVSGHIGYSVVPWKQGHGLAKKALRHMLLEAREVHLKHVELTTDEDNVASQRVILANGGQFVQSEPPTAFISTTKHRYRINL